MEYVSQFQALCVVVKQAISGNGQCSKYGEYKMVKTELNIVEANLTRVCGAILVDQSKKAGGVKPSALPSISNSSPSKLTKMFAMDGVSS